jgi:hypothetical protein
MCHLYPHFMKEILIFEFSPKVYQVWKFQLWIWGRIFLADWPIPHQNYFRNPHFLQKKVWTKFNHCVSLNTKIHHGALSPPPKSLFGKMLSGKFFNMKLFLKKLSSKTFLVKKLPAFFFKMIGFIHVLLSLLFFYLCSVFRNFQTYFFSL